MTIIDSVEIKKDENEYGVVYLMFVNDNSTSFGEVVIQLQKIWSNILGVEDINLINIDINTNFRITVGLFGNIENIHKIFKRCNIGLRTSYFQKQILRLKQREFRNKRKNKRSKVINIFDN